jgi:hypothetical protein
MVMKSLEEAYAPIGVVKWTILLLGIGAVLVALLSMLITARTLLNPAEQIELGVNEVINGNADYTFKEVGDDFEGLANALNVMIARLTGRPEPGDDAFDLERSASSSQVSLDEPAPVSTAAMGGAAALADAGTSALAREPEADYYRRLYREFIKARSDAKENVEGVTLESFTAKLRASEASLKTKHACRMVRFKVVTKDGQVTLKPVPIA